MPEAYVFETGMNEFGAAQPRGRRRTRSRAFYLAAGGALGTRAPAQEGFDEYVSDPPKPVPYVGYARAG